MTEQCENNFVQGKAVMIQALITIKHI